MKIFLKFILLVGILLFAPSSFSKQFRNIDRITRLKPENRHAGVLPVLLEAQVTHFHPKRDGVFFVRRRARRFLSFPRIGGNV